MVREKILLVATSLVTTLLLILLVGLPEGRSEVFYPIPKGQLVISTPAVLQNLGPGSLYIPRVDRRISVRDVTVYNELLERGWNIYLRFEGEGASEFLKNFGILINPSGRPQAHPPNCRIEARSLSCPIGRGMLVVLIEGGEAPHDAVVDLSSTRVTPLLTLITYFFRGLVYSEVILPTLALLVSLSLTIKEVLSGYVKRGRR